MTRHFNTAGPCKADLHYLLPTERRLPELRAVIDGQSYFVLHAPRQVGKTTSLLSLGAELTAEGRYAAVMVTMETGAPFDDIARAEGAILDTWQRDAAVWLPKEFWPPPWPAAEPGSRIRAALEAWARACPRPLVIFLDEIDALSGEVLTSVLRQIRAGHRNRPSAFPWSLALVGLRDVRDYKLASGAEDRAHSSSPFNIKVESFTMRDFTESEVGELYAQHTAETGQRFDDAAVAKCFELTQGQPWLVNALARQAVEVFARDRARPVTVADVMAARDRLIEREDTHLDSLAERLREPRVRAIIDPMLRGGEMPTLPTDDVRLVKDLGLVRETDEGALEIANPIYREIIGRSLALSVRLSMPRITPTWITPDSTLDLDALLAAWVSFWTLHGETLQAKSPYSEAAAHLVLLAFLHRVVNGGGRIEREYAAGTGRMDVRVEFKGAVLAIEVKVWRDGDRRGDPVADGVAQLDRYMARVGAAHGWLVVFDQRANARDITERVRVERAQGSGARDITVVWG